MIDSRLESYYIMDTETLALTDNAVVMDFSIVFVDMNELMKESNGSVMKFIDFYNSDNVKRFTIHPSIKDQKENGFDIDPNTVEFWKSQSKDASESFKKYINEMICGTKTIKESSFEITFFLNGCLNELDEEIQSKNEVFCLERSGGFDTNKFYNFYKHGGYTIKECPIKYWNRREIRTIISSNRYRIPSELLKPNTTLWSDAIVELIDKDMNGEFTKHVAINDCLIDAYMMYFLKMKIDNFYL